MRLVIYFQPQIPPEYTEWQWPLSGIHSIVMEKSHQPGGGGGHTRRPPPFTLSTFTYKVVVCAPAERADKLSLFLLYPNMNSMFPILRQLFYGTVTRDSSDLYLCLEFRGTSTCTWIPFDLPRVLRNLT